MPQEEVPLYESKGKQFVSRQSSRQAAEPVRLPSGHTAHTYIPGLFILEDKEKKQKKKSSSKEKIEQVSQKMGDMKIGCHQDQKSVNDPAKRLKNLKKKVREIETLEEKLKKGEITKPEPEQLAKIKRKNDLLMEINQLEKNI